MPNHCENTLTITGTEEEIKEIWRKYQHKKDKGDPIENIDRALSFQKILPTPMALLNISAPRRKKETETEKEYQKKIKNHEKRYGATDWYEWRLNNWGTKWDSYQCFYSNREKTSMEFSFNTAWGPGNKVFLHLSKLYPKIEIKLEYFEPGMCFAGKYKFKNGEIIEEFYTENNEKIKELYPDFYQEN